MLPRASCVVVFPLATCYVASPLATWRLWSFAPHVALCRSPQLDFCNTAEGEGDAPMSLAGLDPELYYRKGQLNCDSYPVAQLCAAAVGVWTEDYRCDGVVLRSA